MDGTLDQYVAVASRIFGGPLGDSLALIQGSLVLPVGVDVFGLPGILYRLGL